MSEPELEQYPFKQLREELLATSLAQISRALYIPVDALKEYEANGTEPDGPAADVLNKLGRAGDLALSGDSSMREALLRIGRAIRNLDDLSDEDREKARDELLEFINRLGDEPCVDDIVIEDEQETAIVVAAVSGIPVDKLKTYKRYKESKADGYQRPLMQLMRGGKVLRKNVADILGDDSFIYQHWHSGLNDAEKKDKVEAAYLIVTATGWGFQAHGNTLTETMFSFSSVKYRALLKRVVQEFSSGAAVLKQKKPSLKDLEREAANAYATAACKKLKKLKKHHSKLYEKAASVAFGSDLMPSAPHEWSDNPLPPESPLRVLGVLEIASWGKGFVSDSPDWVQEVADMIPDKDWKMLLAELEKLAKKYPEYTALVAVAIGAAFMIARGTQNLYAVGGAMAVIHLSELGINKQSVIGQDA